MNFSHYLIGDLVLFWFFGRDSGISTGARSGRLLRLYGGRLIREGVRVVKTFRDVGGLIGNITFGGSYAWGHLFHFKTMQRVGSIVATHGVWVDRFCSYLLYLKCLGVGLYEGTYGRLCLDIVYAGFLGITIGGGLTLIGVGVMLLFSFFNGLL